MAACRIVNQSVKDTYDAIVKASEDYEAAGEDLVTALTAAIREMEGATKDELQELINSSVKTFVQEQLPGAVMGMSVLLDGNRTNFASVDSQLAASIRESK